MATTTRLSKDTLLKRLNEIKEIASSKEGKCLEEVYINSNTYMNFKCKYEDHPIFKTKSNEIKRGRWCPKCGGSAKKSEDEIINKIDQIGGTYISHERRQATESSIKKRLYIKFICKNGHDTEIISENLNRVIKDKTSGCKLCLNR